MIRIRHRDWDGTLIDVVFTEHTQYIKAKHEGVVFDGACVLADLAGDELEGAIKIGLRRIPVEYGLEELEKVLGTYGFLWGEHAARAAVSGREGPEYTGEYDPELLETEVALVPASAGVV
ncbi:hypothetical protein CPC16_001023 [Podila verticillata]|nr:hypothetical protein CPC16_001023 [Podila verticillata]